MYISAKANDSDVQLLHLLIEAKFIVCHRRRRRRDLLCLINLAGEEDPGRRQPNEGRITASVREGVRTCAIMFDDLAIFIPGLSITFVFLVYPSCSFAFVPMSQQSDKYLSRGAFEYRKGFVSRNDPALTANKFMRKTRIFRETTNSKSICDRHYKAAR